MADQNFDHLDAHHLRVAHDTLLDLPITPGVDTRLWVATIWPDTTQPSGWGRHVWAPSPHGRGWTIHPLTHLGDVIEFGADTHATPMRWYGYVHQLDDVWLTLVGPFATPGEAATDGQRSWRSRVGAASRSQSPRS